jgi:hypothetical protein
LAGSGIPEPPGKKYTPCEVITQSSYQVTTKRRKKDGGMEKKLRIEEAARDAFSWHSFCIIIKGR